MTIDEARTAAKAFRIERDRIAEGNSGMPTDLDVMAVQLLTIAENVFAWVAGESSTILQRTGEPTSSAICLETLRAACVFMIESSVHQGFESICPSGVQAKVEFAALSIVQGIGRPRVVLAFRQLLANCVIRIDPQSRLCWDDQSKRMPRSDAADLLKWAIESGMADNLGRPTLLRRLGEVISWGDGRGGTIREMTIVGDISKFSIEDLVRQNMAALAAAFADSARSDHVHTDACEQIFELLIGFGWLADPDSIEAACVDCVLGFLAAKKGVPTA